MTNYTFPNNFLWGSAISAVQSEGALNGSKSKDVWEQWFLEEPNRFFNGVGPDITSNFYNTFKSDIQNMKNINHNSFRFSISWSRFYDFENQQIRIEGLNFYNNVIDELLKNNIEPIVCLFHFDMPLALHKQGGWLNKDISNDFANYAALVFKHFGEKVKYFSTFCEPHVHTFGTYVYDFIYPGNLVDFSQALKAVHNTILASGKAIKVYKEMQLSGRIGIILNLFPVYTRSTHPEDLKAKNIADLYMNKIFLDPCTRGHYPAELLDILKQYDILPNSLLYKELEIIKENPIDFLGVNYYCPKRVKAKTHIADFKSLFAMEKLFEDYEMSGRKMNVSRGWEVYPKGIYDILIDLKNHYNNIPCYISETGMGVQNEEQYLSNGQIQDDYRIDFIKSHLSFVHKAISNGSACFGYHLWSLFDNWSWLNAYKNRYGLFSIDLQTQTRTPKRSADFYKELAQNNGFSE